MKDLFHLISCILSRRLSPPGSKHLICMMVMMPMLMVVTAAAVLVMLMMMLMLMVMTVEMCIRDRV